MLVPAIEVGGSHVSAAVVSLPAARLIEDPVRLPLAADSAAEVVLDSIAAAANGVRGFSDEMIWGAAVPGPFDYSAGIAQYEGVGKFDALRGVDVGAELARRVPGSAGRWRFCNDADGFGAGCAVAGPLSGVRRAVALTLGTGIGSAFLVDGRPVSSGPGVPEGGEVHLLLIDGAPLEDRVSGRAVRAAYARVHGVGTQDPPEVAAIAELARRGDASAQAVVRDAFEVLGATLAGPLAEFGATDVAVGGSIVGSWDLVEPALGRGLARGGLPDLRTVPIRGTETMTLIGAADLAARRGQPCVESSPSPPG